MWINGFTGHRSQSKHLRYKKLFFFWIYVLIQTIWGRFHQNRSNFRFWLPVQIWNDLWPIILCNLKTKHRRCIKLYIFWILMTRQTIWHCFQRNRSMFQFLTHVELSRSMAAILEMPQYVAYQKNVVYAFIKLRAKSHSFNILCTMDGLSCPTSTSVANSVVYLIKQGTFIHFMRKSAIFSHKWVILSLCCYFFITFWAT